mmetsp:Transcript_25205/g.44054  ORF Transcript_25205/g.44054 Transcript_25205/m.44054 type:complete len:84 (-) Transcript_25205:225-476(-)
MSRCGDDAYTSCWVALSWNVATCTAPSKSAEHAPNLASSTATFTPPGGAGCISQTTATDFSEAVEFQSMDDMEFSLTEALVPK